MSHIDKIKGNLKELDNITDELLKQTSNKNRMVHKGLRDYLDNYRLVDANAKRMK